MSSAPNTGRRSEAGDTLVEVLLAIVILGIASVALLLAFGTSISGSASHRNLATFDTVLRTAAEETTSLMQQQSSSVWGTCGAAGAVTNAGGALTISLPTGYTAQITSVAYWNGSSFSSAVSPPFTAACASNVPANSPELITVQVTSPLGTTLSVSSVVDNPLAPTAPACGAAAQLAFVGQPGTAVSGSNLSPPPVIAVEDAKGCIVTSDFSAVNLAISSVGVSNGATLSSNCSGNDFYGVVTFSNCSTTLAGYYTLTASDGALTSATSNPFTVNPGPPTQLVFTTQPGNGTGGSAFSTQPVVAVEDAFGNLVTSDSSTVTLVVATNPGPGNLTCNPVSAVGGIATFAGCAIDKAAAGYTLTASDGTLTTATSSPLTVSVGPAAQLDFTTSPSNGISAAPFATQPVVAVEDAGGNTVSGNSSAVTLAIGANPGGGHLACTTNPLNAAIGIASFTGCAVDKVGSGYTLTASDGTLATDVSNAFNIVAGVPAKFVFTSTPVSGTAAWSDITGPITVQEQDASGNPTTAAETVMLASSSSGTHIFSTTAEGAL